MGQISPQSAAAMIAFQYPPVSYDTSTRPAAVSPIVSYHQNISTWGSPPDNMGTFEAEFSSPMVSNISYYYYYYYVVHSVYRPLSLIIQLIPMLLHNQMHFHSEDGPTVPVPFR